MVMILSLCTAICGSTSALRKFRPGWSALVDAHAATGDGPETSIGVMAATAVDEVISASALASAEIQTAFLGNFTNPLCVPEPSRDSLTLIPAQAFMQPGEGNVSMPLERDLAVHSSERERPQWVALEEDTPAELQVVVDALLDRVPHLVGQGHHEVLVVGCFRGVLFHMDWGVELDAPLARQWNHSQRSKPGPERCDWEVRQSEEASHRREVGDHRIDLLRSDH